MKKIKISMPIIEDERGNKLIFYHRTNSKNIDQVLKDGFRNGEGQAYGPGLYGAFDLKSQADERMSYYYGDTVLIFEIDSSNFINFNKSDDELIEDIESNNNISNDNKLKLKKSILSSYSEGVPQYTSNLAKSFYKIFQDAGYDGMIFNGRQDGNVVVVWNYTKAIPKMNEEINEKISVMLIEKNLSKYMSYSPPEWYVKKYKDRMEKLRIPLIERELSTYPKYIPPQWYVNRHLDRMKELKIPAIEKELSTNYKYDPPRWYVEENMERMKELQIPLIERELSSNSSYDPPEWYMEEHMERMKELQIPLIEKILSENIVYDPPEWYMEEHVERMKELQIPLIEKKLSSLNFNPPEWYIKEHSDKLEEIQKPLIEKGLSESIYYNPPRWYEKNILKN